MFRGIFISLLTYAFTLSAFVTNAEAQDDRREIRVQSYAGRMLLHVIKDEYDNQLTAIADIQFKANSSEKLSNISFWINPGLEVLQVVDGRGKKLKFSTTIADIDTDAGLSAKRLDVTLKTAVSRLKSGSVKIQYKGKPQSVFSTSSGREISDGEKLRYASFTLGYDGLSFPVPVAYLRDVNDLDNGGGQPYGQSISLTLPPTHTVKPVGYIVRGPTENGANYDYNIQTTKLSNRIHVVVNSLR